MKRAGNLFESIVDDTNLRIATFLSARGKRNRSEYLNFCNGLDTNLGRLSNELLSGTYLPGEFHQFVIHDPKYRIISAPPFRDRVVHHAIIRICEPVFDRWLVDDTYACRKRRGRDRAVNRAAEFARRYGWFLKMDVRRYFDSIPHGRLMDRLHRIFKDRRLLSLLETIIRSFRYSSGTGLPIGSLMSQHFANFYLGWIDRRVKEVWRVPGYVRYMDDMTFWSNSKSGLEIARDKAVTFLRDELSLEPREPTFLNRSSHGVDFLGCRIRSDGVMLNRRSRVRLGRRLGWLESQIRTGEMGEAEYQQRSSALVAFASSCNAASFRVRAQLLKRLTVNDHQARTA